jgi:hypothetical protein
MWTPRAIIVTVIVIVLAGLVLTSDLDVVSKVTALLALVLAEFLALRRR